MSQISDNPAGLLAALDRGKSLPAYWYTDPAITELEIAHVFRKAWNYIGPLSELKNLGDYVTGYAGGVPVVVIRNETDLAGFVNVCRHRRHEVMKGRGNAKVMQCGYHAWTYDLSGCLKGAPRSASEPNFRSKTFRYCRSGSRHWVPSSLSISTPTRRRCKPISARCSTSSPAAASTSTPWSSTSARVGGRIRTGRRCSKIISNAITARSRIRASARPSMCGRKTTIRRRMAGF